MAVRMTVRLYDIFKKNKKLMKVPSFQCSWLYYINVTAKCPQTFRSTNDAKLYDSINRRKPDATVIQSTTFELVSLSIF